MKADRYKEIRGRIKDKRSKIMTSIIIKLDPHYRRVHVPKNCSDASGKLVSCLKKGYNVECAMNKHCRESPIFAESSRL